jgi:hypothetical protein
LALRFCRERSGKFRFLPSALPSGLTSLRAKPNPLKGSSRNKRRAPSSVAATIGKITSGRRRVEARGDRILGFAMIGAEAGEIFSPGGGARMNGGTLAKRLTARWFTCPRATLRQIRVQ